jgi:thymidylate synthase (FAD)
MTAKLVWITPDADNMVGFLARVSNVNAKPEDPSTNLIRYLLEHKHFSPFEMVSACVEIETTRDIARQILRHRSFHFQEFSQRYAEVGQVKPSLREARLQDPKNRQNSLPVEEDIFDWDETQNVVWQTAYEGYQYALECGIAKEQARALLPEGLTNTKMYMSGTLRDWLHYLEVRTGNGTQREHQSVARDVLNVLTDVCPTIFGAAQSSGFNFGSGKAGEDKIKDGGASR